jgi:hypothetical protein
MKLKIPEGGHFFVECRVTPVMATRNTSELYLYIGDFYELPPETPLKEWLQIYEVDLEQTKCFLGLSCHFATVSAVAFLADSVFIVSLFPHAIRYF